MRQDLKFPAEKIFPEQEKVIEEFSREENDISLTVLKAMNKEQIIAYRLDAS